MKGNNRKMSEYEGKVLLIVNTQRNVDLHRSMMIYRIYMRNMQIRALKY